MAFARQFFRGILKKDKVYPWTLAKLVKASGGGTVEDYLNGSKKVKKSEQADSATSATNATNASHATSADSTPLAGRAYTADDAKLIEGLSLKYTMLINNFGINKKCTDVLDLSQCDGQWYGCIGGYTNNMPRGAGIGVKKSMAYDGNWVLVFFLDIESNQIFTNAWSRDGGWKGWHDYHNAGYAINAGNADTAGGYKIGYSGNIVNAGGGETVRIPYPAGMKQCCMACPYNANMDANYAYIESWASRSGYLEVRLNEANSNNIQINTLWLYK